MSGRQTVVFDTTVISNFATTDSLDWLQQSLPDIVVPRAVRTELHRGVERGHSDLSRAVTFLEDPGISVRTASGSPSFDTLDAGETAALVLAEEGGGVLASDDASARAIARSRDVPVTGSVGLLVRGIVRGELDVDTANEWLQRWIDEREYYAPVDHIEEALPDRRDDTV